MIIDWIGVGRGPRTWPLAFLLFASGPAGAPSTLARYTRSIALAEEERVRLPAMMLARPVALDLWSVAHERMTPRQAVSRCRSHRARVESITAALDSNSG